jgi:hypothetical protein
MERKKIRLNKGSQERWCDMYVCVCMKLNAHDEVSKEKAMKPEICREPPEKSPQQTPVKDGVPIYPITPPDGALTRTF